MDKLNMLLARCKCGVFLTMNEAKQIAALKAAGRADDAARVMKFAADLMQADPKNAQNMAAFNKACAVYNAAELAAQTAKEAASGIIYD